MKVNGNMIRDLVEVMRYFLMEIVTRVNIMMGNLKAKGFTPGSKVKFMNGEWFNGKKEGYGVWSGS